MTNKTCVVITSINGSDNAILANYGELCSKKGVGFILAGDTKTPENFNLPGCDYLSIAIQKDLPFKLSKLLPDRNYAKKNIAYLQAIKKGFNVLIETDDDNIPNPEFWKNKDPMMSGTRMVDQDWVNIYSYFSDLNIWPRGFSLD